jgi:hypothetical protein
MKTQCNIKAFPKLFNINSIVFTSKKAVFISFYMFKTNA